MPSRLDPDRYLDRIGLGDDADAFLAGPPTRSRLETLQRRHLRAVPFENLDIVRGVDIRLEHPRLYEKVVADGRGGFCFELNGLFDWLLCELGYDVTRVAARVTGDDGVRSEPYDHLTLLVHLDDGDWLVDVGFGDFARQPLSLDCTPRSDVSGTYRVRALDGDDAAYAAEKRDGDDWREQLVFDPTPEPLSAFAERCSYHQTDPESHFTGRALATRPTESGRVTLSGNALVVTEGGEQSRREAATPGERTRWLREHFDLDVSLPDADE